MGKKILLADDSVTIQKVVELTFMDEDYEVVAVSDGGEAVAKLAEVPADLLIADVHMPGVDGYEVCRRVKEGRPGLPVLLLVGTFEPFDEAKANEVGADGYLKKPFDSQDLLRRVAELTGGGAAKAATEAAPAASPSPVAAAPPAAPETPPAPPAPAPPPAAPPAEAVSAPPPEAKLPVETHPTQARAEEPTAPAAQSAPAAPSGGANGEGGPLSGDDIDRIARRVVELAGDKILREVVWEIVPDLAEVIIRERIRELESQVE